MTFFKHALLAGLTSVISLAATIPAGTSIQIRLGQTIKSDKARSGDVWAGTLASDLVVNGKTLAKRGAPVHGRVVDAEASGRLSGVAKIALQLTSVTMNGSEEPVLTDNVSEAGGNHNKRNGALIGGGAAVGAIIGAIAGGGKGAAIGAGAGGAAGTGGAAATGKKDVTFPVETILTFVTR